MTPQRIILLVGGIAAAVVLFLLVRPGDEEEATTAPATTGPETVAATTATEPERPRSFRITAKGGKPVGGIQRLEARKGERVRIVVRADVADEVHLHGYDLMVDVAPGAPAQLVFTADLTGAFELELEDAKLSLAELEVTP